eukprot:TRINITY_DN25091_c0_g1_i1.p1 TRINITY_DN25091_c0_g1~~TRINITY_DN25091_c0_g1_i1.p1  ORF type:complete len:566 (+),score=146.89 TRINITY_DN25091_c0_g1_i1:68-1699(+)
MPPRAPARRRRQRRIPLTDPAPQRNRGSMPGPVLEAARRRGSFEKVVGLQAPRLIATGPDAGAALPLSGALVSPTLSGSGRLSLSLRSGQSMLAGLAAGDGRTPRRSRGSTTAVRPSFTAGSSAGSPGSGPGSPFSGGTDASDGLGDLAALMSPMAKVGALGGGGSRLGRLVKAQILAGFKNKMTVSAAVLNEKIRDRDARIEELERRLAEAGGDHRKMFIEFVAHEDPVTKEARARYEHALAEVTAKRRGMEEEIGFLRRREVESAQMRQAVRKGINSTQRLLGHVRMFAAALRSGVREQVDDMLRYVCDAVESVHKKAEDIFRSIEPPLGAAFAEELANSAVGLRKGVEGLDETSGDLAAQQRDALPADPPLGWLVGNRDTLTPPYKDQAKASLDLLGALMRRVDAMRVTVATLREARADAVLQMRTLESDKTALLRTAALTTRQVHQSLRRLLGDAETADPLCNVSPTDGGDILNTISSLAERAASGFARYEQSGRQSREAAEAAARRELPGRPSQAAPPRWSTWPRTHSRAPRSTAHCR